MVSRRYIFFDIAHNQIIGERLQSIGNHKDDHHTLLCQFESLKPTSLDYPTRIVA